MDSRTLETFFFGEGSRRLFGALARPTGQARVGIVFSPPYGEEMVNTYNRLSRWSKQLAQQEGIAVLRVHPYGTGESDGTFADYTVDGAAADLVTAVRRLREEPGIEQVGVLGVRFGAVPAIQAAATEKPDFLALWSPVIDLTQYLRELLRFKLTTNMVQQKQGGSKVTLKTMTAELEAGQSVDIVDYELSPAMYHQMKAIDGWPEEAPSKRVLILARPMEDGETPPRLDEWRAQGAVVTAEVHKVPVFWEDFTGGLPEPFTSATKSLALGSAARMAS